MPFKIQNLKRIIGIAGLVLLLLGSLTYNLHQASKNRSLTATVEVLNEQSEQMKMNNFRLIDSLSRISKSFDAVLRKKSKENEVLASKQATLQQKLKQDEEAISRIGDIDSIRTLFAAYYPDNSGTGQTGY